MKRIKQRLAGLLLDWARKLVPGIASVNMVVPKEGQYIDRKSGRTATLRKLQFAREYSEYEIQRSGAPYDYVKKAIQRTAMSEMLHGDDIDRIVHIEILEENGPRGRIHSARGTVLIYLWD